VERSSVIGDKEHYATKRPTRAASLPGSNSLTQARHGPSERYLPGAAQFEDPDITTRPVDIARADLGEQLVAMSLSRMKATTWRWLWTPPFRALVMSFSAMGLIAFALVSVVTIHRGLPR